MGYTIETVNSFEQFRDLKDHWNSLAKKQNSYRPYLDHSWFELWLSHFKSVHRLFIMIVKQDQTIEAICPLLIKRDNYRGIPVKKLELIGNLYSPIRKILYGTTNKEEKMRILEFIFLSIQTMTEWSILDLPCLQEEDCTLIQRVLTKTSFRWKKYFCFGNWYLDDIDVSSEDYLKTRTSNIRSNVKRYRRKLEKSGKLQVLIVTRGTEEYINHLMDFYYRVYANSWKEPEMDSTFHRELAKVALSKGWLRLGFVFLDDEPIACQLWLVCDRVAYIAKLAYDQKYKKFIPGIILTCEMMKRVLDIDKVREIDYLIGDEEYKKDWTPKRRERLGLLVLNNTVAGSILAALILKVGPCLKRWRGLPRSLFLKNDFSLSTDGRILTPGLLC